jgi:hypothetical protein
MEQIEIDIPGIIADYAKYYTSTEPADFGMFQEAMAGFLHYFGLVEFYRGSVRLVESPLEAMRYMSDRAVNSFPRFAKIYNYGQEGFSIAKGVEFQRIRAEVYRSMPVPRNRGGFRGGFGLEGFLEPGVPIAWQDALRSEEQLTSLPAQQMSPMLCLQRIIKTLEGESWQHTTTDYKDAISKSVGGFYVFRDGVIAVDRPISLNIDDRGRLHSTTDAAIRFRDGSSAYVLHGVNVPSVYITHPGTITRDKITYERNVEVRRSLIDLFGMERYVYEMFNGIYVHKDKYGELYKARQDGDEDIAIVKVINSTPEPDGTYKAYFIRVNPNVRTAHEAVASTFRYKGIPLTPEQYNPLQES